MRDDQDNRLNVLVKLSNISNGILELSYFIMRRTCIESDRISSSQLKEQE